jgi:predicted cupin superfamily sugar epimerase
MPTIDNLVKQLGLIPHPEGGFYSETYRSAGGYGHPGEIQGFRSYSTAIYFLLTKGNFSALHRIKSDEVWHFYIGDPVHIHSISPNGEYRCTILGNDFLKGEIPQYVVPAGWWFGSESVGETGYSLVGCTVAPGFDFADFELAEKENLIAKFPQHKAFIEKFVRNM